MGSKDKAMDPERHIITAIGIKNSEGQFIATHMPGTMLTGNFEHMTMPTPTAEAELWMMIGDRFRLVNTDIISRLEHEVIDLQQTIDQKDSHIRMLRDQSHRSLERALNAEQAVGEAVHTAGLLVTAMVAKAVTNINVVKQLTKLSELMDIAAEDTKYQNEFMQANMQATPDREG